MQTQIDPAALTALSFASIVTYLGITAATAVFVWTARLHRRTHLSPLIFGNTGNRGLPPALFAFGDEGLSYVVVFAIMAI